MKSTKDNSTPDGEAILRGVLDRWKAAVDTHDPQRVASLFTEDAIFQGLRPYSVGRQGVADYYASQPLGMTAAYRILETRRFADDDLADDDLADHDLVLGYSAVDFSFTDRPTVSVFLSTLVRHTSHGWNICHYQVSRLG
ncbi:YybH family protein [Streptomyces sp. NPDC059649]|uniref:YybH family protein n=1 Tax=Streptomyces sp. NPDC059649 TaxID=3346895 RepID=UPI0036B39896